MFKPRPSQAEVLRYRGGKMAVLAVPGSGKTQTLSALAASLIDDGCLAEDQEVLVVTLVNSAVNNFSSRVKGLIQRGLPGIGYRVRTLHGLAHDIVRERPGLVGLEKDFQILDERASDEILTEAAHAWILAHPGVLEQYLRPDLNQTQEQKVRRDRWPGQVKNLASAFIKQAKDLQTTPAQIQDLLEDRQSDYPLLTMGQEIYANYQRALAYRGAVDFDDLIRLALRSLILDHEYLDRLRYRWPYILEDEAQDSSRLQEEILRLLSGEAGNWVRVGDPNQAVFETFTTASPRFLREFSRETGVACLTLPESGRSGRPIVEVANWLIDWCLYDHPVDGVRSALDLPKIRMTAPDDPRPNPADNDCQVVVHDVKLESGEELDLIVKSLARWLPGHQDWTVAVLVPRNERGAELASMLRARGLPCVELLRSTQNTRETADLLAAILRYLNDSTSARHLADAYRKIRQREVTREVEIALIEPCARILGKCRAVEAFVHPNDMHDWLEEVRGSADEAFVGELDTYRQLLKRWLAGVILPVDQLVLTIAQDLFREAFDLALADKMAGMLRRTIIDHPDWNLEDFSAELTRIARNDRKFFGLDEDTGFDPDRYPGKVVIATIHKAKGLEWDRVYVTSVNNYDFPSAQAHDTFLSESWYLRDQLNLEAEAINQLRGLVNQQLEQLCLPEGEAGYAARIDYASERLRLFYVALTRARKDLIITYNTGRGGNYHPAAPVIALFEWEKTRHASLESQSAG